MGRWPQKILSKGNRGVRIIQVKPRVECIIFHLSSQIFSDLLSNVLYHFLSLYYVPSIDWLFLYINDIQHSQNLWSNNNYYLLITYYMPRTWQSFSSILANPLPSSESSQDQKPKAEPCPPLVLAVNMVTTPVLHMGKLKHEEIQWCVQQYTTVPIFYSTNCYGFVKFFHSAQTGNM